MSNTTSVDNPILAARKISPLRQRMIDDMTVRNFAPNTMVAYLKQVSYFARHFGKSPERLGPEEIRSYQSYSALCTAPGVRVSEALRLRASNIDSQRMMIRNEQGKGHQDRYVQLSPKLLELLRTYWRKVQPREWLFP